MIIFTIQNVAWPNYFKSLVNINLDNKALMYINIRMNKWSKIDKIEINTAFSKKKYLASSDRKQMHYILIGNYIKAQNVEGSDL